MHSQDPTSFSEPPSETGQPDFRRLLASPQYERLREKLIRIFARRGCQFPQDLADETISRVAEKVQEIAPTYEGDPVRYFYGVARNVYLEYTRRPKFAPLEENRTWKHFEDRDSAQKEKTHACLDRCLTKLPTDQRRLIYEYYRYEKSTKIDYRKELASALGVGLNALRIKAYRIRQGLYQCVLSCTSREESQK